jgi:hypothetical protein
LDCTTTRTHLLEGQGPLDDVLANVIFLGQVEQLPDLGGPLGTQPEIKVLFSSIKKLALQLTKVNFFLPIFQYE